MTALEARGNAGGRLPTLWVNVTDSARTHSPTVGVTRVERMLSEALAEVLGPERIRHFVFAGGRFSTLTRPGARTETPPDQPPQPGDVLLHVGIGGAAGGYAALRDRLGVRVITCCHDLIPILFPQYAPPDRSGGRGNWFERYLEAIADDSDVVLCISRNTQRDFLAFCRARGLAAPRTELLPLGDGIPAADGKVSERVRRVARGRYVLFVSTFERRKNHEVLYRACHLAARAGRASEMPTIVFAGANGWGVDDLKLEIAQDPATRDMIRHLGPVTDAELHLLYRHALFCVYPSLYEGWGLPVAEALSMGRLVVCSNRASLPEVGGDLVPYLDPWNAQAWADTLLALSNAPERVREWEDRIRARYRPRAWARAAEVVAGLVETLQPHPAADSGVRREP